MYCKMQKVASKAQKPPEMINTTPAPVLNLKSWMATTNPLQKFATRRWEGEVS